MRRRILSNCARRLCLEAAWFCAVGDALTRNALIDAAISALVVRGPGGELTGKEVPNGVVTASGLASSNCLPISKRPRLS